MKKNLVFVIALISLWTSLSALAQEIPVYPIPSYNITVESYAQFREDWNLSHPQTMEGKRQVNVMVRSGTLKDVCQASVWVFTLDRTTVLGPYTVDCGNALAVEIDDREWGVLVGSGSSPAVDVWIE